MEKRRRGKILKEKIKQENEEERGLIINIKSIISLYHDVFMITFSVSGKIFSEQPPFIEP